MRATRCMTWGEERRSGSPVLGASGERIGFVDFSEWVTLCGRQEDSPKEAASYDAYSRRPKGVCPKCWGSFRKTMLKMVEENPA
jgi:hypothetical protein